MRQIENACVLSYASSLINVTSQPKGIRFTLICYQYAQRLLCLWYICTVIQTLDNIVNYVAWFNWWLKLIKVNVCFRACVIHVLRAYIPWQTQALCVLEYRTLYKSSICLPKADQHWSPLYVLSTNKHVIETVNTHITHLRELQLSDSYCGENGQN